MGKRQLNKQQAFNEEILPHLDALYNFALRLTTDPSDSEDLVQDTFFYKSKLMYGIFFLTNLNYHIAVLHLTVMILLI